MGELVDRKECGFLKNKIERYPLLRSQIANLVTLSGVVAAGAMAIAFECWPKTSKTYLICLLLMVFIALTDKWDGQLARSLEIETEFGSDLDKVRDKAVAFYILIRQMPRDLAVLSQPLLVIGLTRFIVCLEVLLVIIWVLARLKGYCAQSNDAGKVKMALYYCAFIWWMMLLFLSRFTEVPFVFHLILIVSLGLASYLAVLSLWAYLIRFFQITT